MKKATAKNKCSYYFSFIRTMENNAPSLFFSVCWVDQHAVKGDSSQPLPFFSLHARKCVWRQKRKEAIGRTHPGVKFTHDCWRPSSAPSLPQVLVYTPPPQFSCQRPSCCNVMCWHCGSRWESQHWLLVQWAPRGVLFPWKSTKLQSQTSSHAPITHLLENII